MNTGPLDGLHDYKLTCLCHNDSCSACTGMFLSVPCIKKTHRLARLSAGPAALRLGGHTDCQPAVAAAKPDKERPASTLFLRSPLTSATRGTGRERWGGEGWGEDDVHR